MGSEPPAPGDLTRTLGVAGAGQPRRIVVEVVSNGRPAVLRARSGVVRVGRDPGNEVVIEDEFVSRVHAEVHVRPHLVEVRDCETKNGTHFHGARIRSLPICSEVALVLGRNVPLRIRVIDEAQPAARPGVDLLGDGPAATALRAMLDRLAPTHLTVLIEGETGTGKEVVARSLHLLSPRASRPMVVFDCAAASPSLLGAELFGHARGAFTGAVAASVGAFRAAEGGTLFIDEIGELPLELQPALLRALEARQVKPLGSSGYVPVDVRVVAATNRDLEAEVAAGRFRADLLYRLAVARVRVPPLRARREDVPLLAAHFAAALGARFTDGAAAALAARAWPGNVRELRNVVERAVMLAGGPGVAVGAAEVAADDAPGAEGDWEEATRPEIPGGPSVEAVAGFHAGKQDVVDAFELRFLRDLIAATGHNLSEAARRSGLDRGHLRQLLRKHGIDLARTRGNVG